MNISFIVPAFNCADTLEESINSIYKNNFESGDEVIIVNDASTDNTANVIETLQNNFPNIKTFSHNINKGSAAASRNTGIDNSKNNLLFCLDADNVLTENSIKPLKEFWLKKKADAAAFGEIHFFLSEKNKFTHKWVLNDNISLIDNINTTQKTPCSAGNYLFTKQSWLKAGRYNENIGGAYDSWAFGMMQLITGAKICTLPNTHYLHRHGYESTFVKESKKVNASITALQILLPYLDFLHTDDVNYILSKEARNNWFNNTDKRPVRLKEEDIQNRFLKKIITKAKVVFPQKA